MQWIVGIDEVGRGALAGPVVVAAAAIPKGRSPRNFSLGPLKDSKKMTAKRREAWFAHCTGRPDVRLAVARVYPRGIERLNISNAANLAAKKAFLKLGKRLGIKASAPVFLDGGLFLGNGPQPINAKTVVKGDEKYPAIKIASIAAKVIRDRYMCRLAKKYPAYGFEVHKGYGTKMHLGAIKKHGPAEPHRLTFQGNSAIMNA